MRLGLLLKTVAVKTKKAGAIGKEKEIGAGGEIDEAEGDTNKAIKPHSLIFTPFHSAFSRNLAGYDPLQKPYVFVAESVQCNVTTSMPDNARMEGVDQESVFAVIDQLGHAVPVKGDHGRAAGHGFDDRQTERILKGYGEQHHAGLAEQPVAIDRPDTADVRF